MLAQLTLLDKTAVPVASKALDAYTMRGRAIANNIANVTTPGYQRLEVSFEDELRKHLDEAEIAGTRTSEGHFRLGRPELDQVIPEAYQVDDPTKAGEINNVDIDMEAAKLAENQIQFNFAVKFIQDRMGTVTEAIKGQPTG